MYFDKRLWALTRGLRDRMVWSVIIGLLASLVGLQSETGLALSLAKRARELLLGLPGLLYLHFSERNWQRRHATRVPAVD